MTNEQAMSLAETARRIISENKRYFSDVYYENVGTAIEILEDPDATPYEAMNARDLLVDAVDANGHEPAILAIHAAAGVVSVAEGAMDVTFIPDSFNAPVPEQARDVSTVVERIHAEMLRLDTGSMPYERRRVLTTNLHSLIAIASVRLGVEHRIALMVGESRADRLVLSVSLLGEGAPCFVIAKPTFGPERILVEADEFVLSAPEVLHGDRIDEKEKVAIDVARRFLTGEMS